jgi:hypothetical protein
VVAKLRMMWSEIYRLRRVHKHCYEYAQLAVLARLRTWAAARQCQADFDVSTLALLLRPPGPCAVQGAGGFQRPHQPAHHPADRGQGVQGVQDACDAGPRSSR